jgi:hypothetical protein
MKGFGFKQLRRQEGPSFYLQGFREPRKRVVCSPGAKPNNEAAPASPIFKMEEFKQPQISKEISHLRST